MYLDLRYKDALRELLNIGAGRAAAELNAMVETPIQLRIPAVELVSSEGLKQHQEPERGEPVATVQLPFSGTFSGEAVLGFPWSSASKLVTLLMGEEDDGGNAVRATTLTEVGNILLNSVLGTMANVLSGELEYQVPVYKDDSDALLHRHCPEGAAILLTKTRFITSGHEIEGDIRVVLAGSGFSQLTAAINVVDPVGDGSTSRCDARA